MNRPRSPINENCAIAGFISGLMLALTFAGGLARGQSPSRPPASYPPLPEWIRIQRDIHYDRYPATVLDVLQPSTRSGANAPGVIVFHGGGWIHSGKETAYRSLCLPYLERGFVVANVEYRVATQATAPAAVKDALNATHWFFKHARDYDVDPRRIVVTGGSAGGHLALMVGMTPKSAHLGPVSPVAAVIDGYGITDAVELLNGPHRQFWADDWIPASPQRVELARLVSPLTYVRHDLPPILIAQGADDHTVPVEQSVRLHDALDMDNVPNELVIVPDAKHGFSRDQWNTLDVKIFAFLKEHGIEGPRNPSDTPAE
ncbi:MAG TPA: alpha/beta hydrolase [Terracidiphilus sp.]